jgi:1-deoxy-D-xylulose-5-phosphate synthase
LEQAENRDAFLAFGPEEDAALCAEIRSFLIGSVSKTGGHLASNLGAVELTVALHKVFDPYRDRIVFDVGHQSYVHKLLTGRKEGFQHLRQFGGMAGFPRPSESEADAFVGGHASNSVSAALGMARARTLSGEDYSVIAVIGDGALTGGLAYEGLNDAGQSKEPLIVVLNDNGMSIQPNVGAMAKFLARQRLKPSYFQFKRIFHMVTDHAPGGEHVEHLVHRVKLFMKNALIGSTIFEEMGFIYLGPIDGHDIKKMTHLLRQARTIGRPVLLHVTTTKGRGYSYAEENPDEYHGVSAFNVQSGASAGSGEETFSSAFGKTMCAMAEEDHRICAVTAAMEQGTGLSEFAESYPKRFFDVGIAEGHAVTMASGLAKQGMLPVVAVYSTFLQRAYDMMIHDTAIAGLHVVFAVDRAGLVGADGETHHGAFDVGYLRTVPGMAVFAPASTEELRKTLHHAVYQVNGPAAVRYPRGGNDGYTDCILENCILQPGEQVTIVTYGTMVREAMSASEKLQKEGISAEVIKLWQLAPLDISLVEKSVRKTGRLIVLEECVSSGCVGQELVTALAEKGALPAVVRLMNLGSGFVTHGKVPQLRHAWHIDGDAVYETVKELVNVEKGTS